MFTEMRRMLGKFLTRVAVAYDAKERMRRLSGQGITMLLSMGALVILLGGSGPGALGAGVAAGAYVVGGGLGVLALPFVAVALAWKGRLDKAVACLLVLPMLNWFADPLHTWANMTLVSTASGGTAWTFALGVLMGGGVALGALRLWATALEPVGAVLVVLGRDIVTALRSRQSAGGSASP